MNPFFLFARKDPLAIELLRSFAMFIDAGRCAIMRISLKARCAMLSVEHSEMARFSLDRNDTPTVARPWNMSSRELLKVGAFAGRAPLLVPMHGLLPGPALA